jgi:hypothetical protein
MLTYYEIVCLENADDDLERLPWKGAVRFSKWMRFSEDTDLPLETYQENESLAMRILIENLNTHHFKGKNVLKLKKMIDGKYARVLIRKYESEKYVEI